MEKDSSFLSDEMGHKKDLVKIEKTKTCGAKCMSLFENCCASPE